jgi:hopanoid biosynthesis associated protein HpnK
VKRRGRKGVILNADDFGLSTEVNDAVIQAHRHGVLAAASLMVAEAAAADAARRAAELGTLRVGLHVTLVAGRALSEPETIPALAGPDGRLSDRLPSAGVRFFFRPGIRAQLEREIRAQFEAFARTGLPLDHVNAQCHLHVHPTVFDLIVKVARDYGSPPMRLPYEPFPASWRSGRDRVATRLGHAYLLAPWLRSMKRRMERAGIRSNDYVFGIGDAGRMTQHRVESMLEHLPDGVTELFFHAATGRWPGIPEPMTRYRLEDELAALTSDRVRRALEASGAERIAYADLARG